MGTDNDEGSKYAETAAAVVGCAMNSRRLHSYVFSVPQYKSRSCVVHGTYIFPLPGHRKGVRLLTSVMVSLWHTQLEKGGTGPLHCAVPGPHSDVHVADGALVVFTATLWFTQLIEWSSNRLGDAMYTRMVQTQLHGGGGHSFDSSVSVHLRTNAPHLHAGTLVSGQSMEPRRHVTLALTRHAATDVSSHTNVSLGNTTPAPRELFVQYTGWTARGAEVGCAVGWAVGCDVG